MKPAMRMLAMDKLRQTDQQPRSEYGSTQNRRMIGYDRDYGREHTPSSGNYNNGRHMPPMDTYGGGYGGGYEGPESRRRRDSRGRFAMMEDDYDEPQGYRPRMMGGNSYGDIYAEGKIYAPGAMNKPMGGMMGGMMGGNMSEPVDEHTARMWVQRMDGGEKFKPEQTDQFRAALCPHCDKWEYYTAINAMYSDYCETAKKMGMDKPEFYANLAKDFLNDKDAGPHKLRKYMETIPK